MREWLLGLGLMLAAPVMASKTVPPAPKLTLHAVFGSPELSGPRPRALKLSPDGTLLTFLKPRADDKDRLDLWARDTHTGAERLLVDSRKLGSGADLSEAEKMQRERARIGGSKGIVSYDWAPQGGALLVPLDGDLYLANLDGTTRKLTAKPGGELNPAISPRGGYVSFVRDQNLWVMPLGDDAARPLTSAGGGTVHFGEAEFVAQEEMDRRTGFWWSPDEAHVAVERFDEAPVHIATRAAIGAQGTSVYQQRYPAAGTSNVLVELHIMRPDGSGDVKVDLGPEPDIYLARVDWFPDGRALLVQRENRAQTQLDVLRVDPATGAATLLFSEHSGPRSWVNLTDAYKLLKDGSLIWRSERDGFGHLYRWRDGAWMQLTSGPWVVSQLAGVDEAAARLFFVANKDGPLEQHLYALDYAHPGAITRLTPAGGWNDATMNDTATRAIITHSSPNRPAQVYLADASGARLGWIEENALRPGHPYYPYVARHRPTQFGTFKAADGTTLYYEMITPPLVRGKRYPVFFEHYGGPGTGQQVTDAWGGALHQYIVQQGWIYFRIDNRGSYARGKAFEDYIYHAMGTVEVADQLAGAHHLQALAFVDPARIATFGWSYGGYMSLKMLERTPGVYAAAVAGAPVSDWQLYDTHYAERYLGQPALDPQSYAGSQAFTEADKIRDPLLLIHGMSDDNVFLDNSLKVAAKMQGAGVPFEMMFYPGQTHRVGGPGVSEHLWGTIMDFLDRRVKGKAAK